ncbi:MAG TPA: PspC domain-containing protein [Candidatus Saccharimonadales bacterium]|nr:PspC domain-containing protein [Candidatus Saccharimonadales bacterium]
MAKETPKKLYRSETDRVIAGVCGGLGDFFEVDSTIVRIIFILLALGGVGVVLYLILMFVIPTQSTKGADEREKIKNNAEAMAEEVKRHAKTWGDRTHSHSETRVWLGIALMALGVLWLLQAFNIIVGFNFWRLWPILLIVVGLTIIGRRHND